jgi:hypothetical protein
VLTITGEQLGWFAGATFALRPLVPAGVRDAVAMVALPAFCRSSRCCRFRGSPARPDAGGTGRRDLRRVSVVVCTLWHGEHAVLHDLHPLAALVLAGTIGRSRIGLGLMDALVVLSAVGFVGLARILVRLPQHACAPVLAEVVRDGRQGES